MQFIATDNSSAWSYQHAFRPCKEEASIWTGWACQHCQVVAGIPHGYVAVAIQVGILMYYMQKLKYKYWSRHVLNYNCQFKIDIVYCNNIPMALDRSKFTT